jgi:hypothetical protein
MKPGLLERIRGYGHWRVVIRPIVPLTQILTYQECRQRVEQSRVSIRGWDYPHMASREDDQGGEDRGDGYLENWCDWHTQVEFWRMYRSGQFLSYNSLYEDVSAPEKEGDARDLNITSAIYEVTEFVEFAHRLAHEGLYRDGYQIEVSLNNTRGRYLEAGRGRMPFFDRLRTGSETIRVYRIVNSAELEAGAIPTSLSMLLELFDAFGWNPQPGQIRHEQEAYYRREFR